MSMNVHTVGDAFIDLSLGDCPAEAHPLINEGIAKDLEKGFSNYSPFRGDPELTDAILEAFQTDHGLAIDRDQVLVTASSSHAMWMLLTVLLRHGGDVLVPVPCYPPYRQQVALCGGTLREIDLGDGYAPLTWADIEILISERTRVLILNSPCNPTGSVIDEQVMREILEECRRRDVFVIFDDCYQVACYEKAYRPVPRTSDEFVGCAILTSFSKDYGLAGWRVGHMIADPKILDRCVQVNEGNIFTAPSMSQRAALHALTHRCEIRADVSTHLRDARARAVASFGAIPGWSCRPPAGAIYLWCDVSSTGMSGPQAARRACEVGVGLQPGSIFGGSRAYDYVRLSFSGGAGRLTEAAERIRAACWD